ncbi:HD-GYP domain-containing protein [Sulfurospirillum oryzae]|uniref:HD-GYP domain-containing protein n=1 Tax=Sulfurospirillum oryzae TaxID=2976535 RepID=UPI0021E8C9FE|nr:HD-GYP domain-containing protein [Sulfurospirillum oryzae]
MSVLSEPLFHNIPLCAIKPGMQLDFNLYLERENKFHLIVEKGDIYPEKLTDNIKNTNDLSEYFYIHLTEKPSYDNHIESYLKKISSDDTIPLNEKSLLVYKSTSDAINDLLKNPESKKSLERTKTLVDHTINIILNYDTSIKSMMSIGSHDYYTYTHSVDVSVFVIGFANYLGFSFENLRNIGYAAMMHDIGKNKIPHEIINKNGKLTDEEFSLMKSHPCHSYDVLKFHDEINEDILMGVRSHHEKARGNGYPDGLKLHEINDFAKIISLCDIFSALTTKRSYKNAFSSFKSLQMMKQEMINDFDEKLFYDFIRFIGKSCTHN